MKKTTATKTTTPPACYSAEIERIARRRCLDDARAEGGIPLQPSGVEYNDRTGIVELWNVNGTLARYRVRWSGSGARPFRLTSEPIT